jgi:hypothetical protein
MPRSASSVTLELICQKLKLQNFGEINNPEIMDNHRFAFMYSPDRRASAHRPGFSDVPRGFDMIPWLQQREPWAIKFLTNHAGTDLAQYLEQLQPQHVIITHRQDTVAGFLSLCWAQQHQIYHHRGRPRPVTGVQQYIDPVLAQSWLDNVYQPYLRDCAVIQASGTDVKVWTKEHIESNGELELSGHYFTLREFRGRTVPSEIDYRSWCANLSDITNIIHRGSDA